MYSLILLLSELLPQFVLIFSPHIDGTQRQMMCKFEETLIVTFRANQPFFFWAQLLMQSTALRNDLPFESDMYSLNPSFI